MSINIDTVHVYEVLRATAELELELYIQIHSTDSYSELYSATRYPATHTLTLYLATPFLSPVLGHEYTSMLRGRPLGSDPRLQPLGVARNGCTRHKLEQEFIEELGLFQIARVWCVWQHNLLRPSERRGGISRFGRIWRVELTPYEKRRHLQLSRRGLTQ